MASSRTFARATSADHPFWKGLLTYQKPSLSRAFLHHFEVKTLSFLREMLLANSDLIEISHKAYQLLQWASAEFEKIGLGAAHARGGRCQKLRFLKICKNQDSAHCDIHLALYMRKYLIRIILYFSSLIIMMFYNKDIIF